MGGNQAKEISDLQLLQDVASNFAAGLGLSSPLHMATMTNLSNGNKKTDTSYHPIPFYKLVNKNLHEVM